MKKIFVSDITLRESSSSSEHSLSFKEKIEMAKLMDKVHYDSIEMPEIKNVTADVLLIKTIASLMKHSEICVPVGYEVSGVETAWNCVKDSAKSALKVSAPVSAVQMEFKCGKKPPVVLKMIEELVTECKKYTDNIELSAEDAIRGEKSFLYDAINTAIKAGATRINICDSEGTMLPDEFKSFVDGIYENIDGISELRLSVEICDQLNMATACAFAAVSSGVTQIKSVVCDFNYPSIENIMNVFRLRGDSIKASSKIRTTELKRVIGKMQRTFYTTKSATTPFENGVNDTDEVLTLNKNDDIGKVIKAVKKIGYELSAEDNASVYAAFKRVASKKDFVGTKELEAIVASSSLQVPSKYTLESYVINSGNIITATANIKLTKDGEPVSGVSVGDGPIDASFLAIEQIVGHHYELDDFQIRAVTEGHEAMGSSLVKLRSSNGKLYSGTGISTDVIGASIRAYVSALNKIAYEEE